MSSKKNRTRPPADPEKIAAARRRAILSVLTLALICSCAVGYFYLTRYVEAHAFVNHDPPVVVLKNRPVWMSDFLADTIATSVRPDVGRSPLDHRLLKDAVSALSVNPWIKSVGQVRRVYGRAPGDTIEVDCEYRAPVALVRYDAEHFALVDDAGVVLPEQFTASEVPRILYGADGRMNIRLIEGVTRRPNSAGQKWPGEDLAAGLEIVKLLNHQPWAEEIVKLNVANFAGRKNTREPQIVMVTRYMSELRWGRWTPPGATDKFLEVSTEQKLHHLQQIHRKFHRIDANQPWLDLRFDQVVYPMQSTARADAR